MNSMKQENKAPTKLTKLNGARIKGDGFLNCLIAICPQRVPEFKFPNRNRGIVVCFKDWMLRELRNVEQL